MKNLNIPSALFGLVFGLIGGVFVYLFIPPPSSVSANDCPAEVFAYNCATPNDVMMHCATDCDCATKREVKKWCYLMHD